MCSITSSKASSSSDLGREASLLHSSQLCIKRVFFNFSELIHSFIKLAV